MLSLGAFCSVYAGHKDLTTVIPVCMRYSIISLVLILLLTVHSFPVDCGVCELFSVDVTGFPLPLQGFPLALDFKSGF